MSNRLIQAAALVLTAVGILLAFLITPTINQQRVDRQLTYDLEVGSNANPAYTLGASLGSFRGVLINILWQRSEQLKTEEKYFESNNLAEYITTLQPRFPDAWDIQAWNMAYNISVKTKTAEERWDWVNKGMTLLRDRGIPNNPNAVVLYRSIAWILGHKMTGQTDDMHWYYKARMAETWQTLLGVPSQEWMLKPEFRDPANRPLDEDLDPLVHGEWLATKQFERIAKMAQTYLEKSEREEGDFRASNYFTTLSPENLARFYADHPGLQTVIRELQKLKGPNDEDLDLGLNTRTLRAFGKLQMYQDAGYNIASPTVFTPETLGLDAMAIYMWITQRQSKDVLNLNPMMTPNRMEQFKQANPDREVIDLIPLLNMMRALALVGDYHMDPAFMLETMERYGPIDWRHPAAHAMYWSALGTLRAEEWTQNKERIDFINANRNIIHNLQHLAHNGKINFRPKVTGMGEIGKETINHAPDVRMIPAYDKAWEDVMAKIEAGEFGEKKKTQTFANGHENFLQSAVYLYYYDGQEVRARDYFKRAKELYENSEQSPAAREGHYELNLADFARVRQEDDLGFQNVQKIIARIKMAWTQGLDRRSRTVMQRYLDAAKASYDEFLEDRQTNQKADLDVQGRQNLPPFEDMVLAEFVEIMASTQYSLPQKARTWQLARPLLAGISDERALIYEAYGRMMPFLTSQAELEGQAVDINTVFPQPPGYDQWYQQNITPQQPGLPGAPQPSQTR
jgi:hypothetical protein